MKTLCLLTFLAISTIAFNPLFSQTTTYGDATLSAPACIILDSAEPISENYKMDLTVLGFISDEEAQNWAGHYSNNLITLSANFALGEAYIQIHNELLASPQSVTWWNNYLADLCTYYTAD